MREGSLCSIILHGALAAALVWSFSDDGGAPQMGGGAQAIEIVMVPSTAGTNAEETVEANAEVAEEIELASAPPPPPQQRPARPVTRMPPPPQPQPQPQPVEPVVEELPPLPAPVGEEALLPPVPTEAVPMPEDLEALLEPPPPEPLEPEPLEVVEPLEPVELPDDLEALLDPPEPEPQPEPEVQPEDLVPPEKPARTVTLPEVKQAVAKKKEPAETKPEAEPKVVGTENQQLATAATQPAQPGANEASSAPSGASTAGLAPGQLESYAGLLQAWLEKHKRYPDAARRRRHEGIVTVEFTIDGQGNVVRHRIVNDSGYQLLDKEAEDLLARASPVPAPPDGRGRTFVVPINFEIR